MPKILCLLVVVVCSLSAEAQTTKTQKPCNYSTFVSKVEKGERGILYNKVKPPDKLPQGLIGIAFSNKIEAGVWECFSIAGEAKMIPYTTPATAVITPKTAGAGVLMVAGHSHKCVDSSCGHVWQHVDKGLKVDDHFCPKCGKESRIQHEENILVPESTKNGNPRISVKSIPYDTGKKKSINGVFYSIMSDGTLQYCQQCNLAPSGGRR